jgi:hypothetical protein
MIKFSSKSTLYFTAAIMTLCAVPCVALEDGHSNTALVTLSDGVNPAYRRLARLQKSICEAVPTHSCNVDEKICAANLRRRLELTFSQNSEPRVEDKDKIVEEACRIRGSPYEIAGIHWLLQQRYDDVLRSGQYANILVPRDVAFGALPLADYGAEVINSTKKGESVILINLYFLEFANTFSELIFQTIPHKTIAADVQQFDLTEEGGRKYISEHPELMERLFVILDHFRKNDPLDDGPPIERELSEFMGGAYSSGMADFAMAHELGHIYFGHASSSLDLSKFFVQVKEFIWWKKSGVSRRIQELEADSFAIRILLNLRDRKVREGEAHENTCILKAAEFYFIARVIVALAGISAHHPDPDGLSEEVDYNDVEEVAKCVDQPTCRVRDIKNLSSQTRSGSTHPTDMFRAAVIRKVLENHPAATHSEWLPVCEAVNRNAILLWKLSQDEYYRQKPWSE